MDFPGLTPGFYSGCVIHGKSVKLLQLEGQSRQEQTK
jgi:hypothetical protein